MAEVELQATIDGTRQHLKELEGQRDLKILQVKQKAYQEEESKS